MMNKSGIKVHLTEEQTENNSGMISPQAVNGVRRAAGSGGSGSGSGSSGGGGRGPEHRESSSKTERKQGRKEQKQGLSPATGCKK